MTNGITSYISCGSAFQGISERKEQGFTILSPIALKPTRRILYINSYGGPPLIGSIRSGLLAPHHLWGCLELVRRGYEIAVAEPLPHFYLYKRPLPHDLRLLPFIREWLGQDGIVYCAHTLLYWLPLLKALHALKCHVVSLTYAREKLDFSTFHSGIVALTPAAADQARKLAPKVKVSHIGWGVDVQFYPHLEYRPEWFLSCGIANRDFHTLSAAAFRTRQKLRVICPGIQSSLLWPDHATILDGGKGWHTEKHKPINVQNLISDHYSQASASLIVMQEDPAEYTANGFTNLMESMALGRPVIVTRTGALPGELDVEEAGCGLHVPPNDPEALARAIDELAADPDRARNMGNEGRRLCERHYNLNRCAADLHAFFESL